MGMGLGHSDLQSQGIVPAWGAGGSAGARNSERTDASAIQVLHMLGLHCVFSTSWLLF